MRLIAVRSLELRIKSSSEHVAGLLEQERYKKSLGEYVP